MWGGGAVASHGHDSGTVLPVYVAEAPVEMGSACLTGSRPLSNNSNNNDNNNSTNNTSNDNNIILIILVMIIKSKDTNNTSNDNKIQRYTVAN